MRKYFLLILYLTAPLFVFCQANDDNKMLTANDYKIHGYSNGIRLDSIPVEYVSFLLPNSLSLSDISNYVFDFGQQLERKKIKNLLLADKEGRQLNFRSIATLLNFLDFNGWELKQVVVQPASYFNYVYLFKKK
ncbi:MAG: hypothetical protein K2Q21_04840 [Chitinophagaceae bacterium]|nr:hypothetical protein [Chitinophagaceae bacterium]